MKILGIVNKKVKDGVAIYKVSPPHPAPAPPLLPTTSLSAHPLISIQKRVPSPPPPEKPAIETGVRRIDVAKIIGITPEVLSFSGI